MIEVRFFSTLREGRGKITQVPAEEVAILLINGFHSKPADSVKDGDVILLFPPVGGG